MSSYAQKDLEIWLRMTPKSQKMSQLSNLVETRCWLCCCWRHADVSPFFDASSRWNNSVATLVRLLRGSVDSAILLFHGFCNSETNLCFFFNHPIIHHHYSFVHFLHRNQCKAKIKNSSPFMFLWQKLNLGKHLFFFLVFMPGVLLLF